MLEKLKAFKGKFRYDDSEMPFLEHLEEFRKTVIRCFIALAIAMTICLPFADELIGVLRAPAEPYIIKNASEVLDNTTVHLRIAADSIETNALQVAEDGSRYYDVKALVELPESSTAQKGGIRLQFSEPAAAFKMWLTVTFFGGILISLPFLVFFIGLFVMPGVRDVERKVMTRISFFSGGLFLVGIAMGYKMTLPLALGLMLKIGGQLGGESIWFYNKYIGFALQLLLGFGLAFQLPVVILIMGRMGLVSSSQLRDKRRHVIVAMFVLAMVLTPPDPMTQVLMALPLILLYEFCIWFLHFSGNREPSPSGDTDDDSADPTDEDAADESKDDHEKKDSTEENT
ncbi:twin-arginine translocase subunit TatC [Pontiella sp.]|uniref:twin-arginine translocase subunit TatC n=1 Tax=Pontiella sp. TaxID=2837462 RepID=UPI003566F17C